SGHMAITRDEAIGVTDIDGIPVTRLAACEDDRARAGGQHLGAGAGRKIEPGMKGGSAGERVLADAEGGTGGYIALERLANRGEGERAACRLEAPKGTENGVGLVDTLRV